MTVRAIATGVPTRLQLAVGAIPGVLMLDDLYLVGEAFDDNPHAAVIYGEDLFGEAATGQPVLFLPEQKASDDPDASIAPLARVIMLVDHNPTRLDVLDWDDPRRLLSHAAVRLRASKVIDVSEPGAWLSLDVLLDEVVDIPPDQGA